MLGGSGHAPPENFEILNSCRYIFLHSKEHIKAALLHIDKLFMLACWAASGWSAHHMRVNLSVTQLLMKLLAQSVHR